MSVTVPTRTPPHCLHTTGREYGPGRGRGGGAGGGERFTGGEDELAERCGGSSGGGSGGGCDGTGEHDDTFEFGVSEGERMDP